MESTSAPHILQKQRPGKLIMETVIQDGQQNIENTYGKQGGWGGIN